MRSPRNAPTALESPRGPVSAEAATTGPSPARALRERVVGATAIALAASLVIENLVVLAGAPAYSAHIKGGAGLPCGAPGCGRDRGRHGSAERAAAARVPGRSPRAHRAPRRSRGRGLVAPRDGRGRLLLRGRDDLRRFVGRCRTGRRQAHRADPGVRARLAHARGSVRAIAAGTRHYIDRRCTSDTREKADAPVAVAVRR